MPCCGTATPCGGQRPGCSAGVNGTLCSADSLTAWLCSFHFSSRSDGSAHYLSSVLSPFYPYSDVNYCVGKQDYLRNKGPKGKVPTSTLGTAVSKGRGSYRTRQNRLPSLPPSPPQGAMVNRLSTRREGFLEAQQPSPQRPHKSPVMCTIPRGLTPAANAEALPGLGTGQQSLTWNEALDGELWLREATSSLRSGVRGQQ